MMGKGLSTAALVLLLVFSSKAQIPQLFPNTMPWFVENSSFRKEFTGKYDMAIAYYNTGGWSNQEFYYSILAFKKHKWYKIVYIRDKDFGKGQPKAKFEKKRISNRIADSIILVLGSNNFWNLDNVELNRDSDGKYYDADAHKYLDNRISISDGITNVFEIIYKKTYRVTYSYEPDDFFKDLPGIKQRGLFINARRAFLTVFPNVWQPSR